MENRKDGQLVTSTVHSVTFFEDRAEVVREIQGVVPAGESVARLRVSGISPFIDDGSASAECVGEVGCRIVSCRVSRHFQGISPEEIVALEEKIGSLGMEHLACRRNVFHSDANIRRLSGLYGELIRSLRMAPPEGKVAEWTEALGEVSSAMDDAIQAKADARLAELLAKEAVAKAERELQIRRTRSPECVAEVEVQVARGEGCCGLDEPAPCTVRLKYRTPCALWRPAYIARLLDDDASPGASSGSGTDAKTLEIIRQAAVWQMTGEDWEGATLRFSTARPSRNASAPFVESDFLHLRKKTDEEEKRIKVEVRNQAVSTLSRGGMDEIPGVDDGGVAREFQSMGTGGIPSDGLVHRVELECMKLPVKAGFVAMPELSTAVFLKAESTLKSGMPMLSGPVQLFRNNGAVGRCRMDYVAPGEGFTLGFGRDDEISIRRNVTESRKDGSFTSKRRISRHLSLCISNLSGKEKRFSVKERIPVSEISAVRVEVESSTGFSAPDRDGFVTADVVLPPNSQKSLGLLVNLEMDDKVDLKI